MSESPQIVQASQEHRTDSFSIVGMGASAGGLDAFKDFFAQLPPEPGMAFVLIQHLSPEHDSMIPELLASSTRMPVRQVSEAVRVEVNHIYVIAPNSILALRDRVLLPEPPREPHGFRSPIDFFLRSLAETEGEKAIGVVLCGAGTDGTLGLQAIKRNGGFTFVQDPETCRHDSMPKSAIAAGIADQVLPIDGIALRLLDVASFGTPFPETFDEDSKGDVAGALSSICALLSERLGHDFSRYKQSTMVRRIQRRMHMLRLAPAADYLDLLHKDPAELEQLFKDLLISVTEFFRDREAFEVLAQRVIPKIFQHPNQNGTVRVWVPGCATGQEAYSLAILLKEYMARGHAQHPVQIFATDIDAAALETARLACYGEEVAEQVSRERLNRYFNRLSGGYQVSKEVREMCIFSVHNVVTDPPFSRMDLVSCRNLLIYFDAALQQRVIPLFHYALRSGGYLFLGPAESLGTHADAFHAIEKRLRIFQAKPSSAPTAVRMPRADGARSNRIVVDTSLKLRIARQRDAKDIHERAILDWYAPPSVFIDANGEVLHFVRKTTRFLEPPVGSPSHNIFDIIRDELRLPLRAALNEARSQDREAIRESIEVEDKTEVQPVSLIVRPLRDGENAPDRFIVVFREEGRARLKDDASAHTAVHRSEEAETVQHLEHELRSTKEYLQSTIEELENSNEELKSSNEELISINEEYQSANESLQTSKEELQSLNEELETVNAEVSKKLEELDRTNADIQNLFSSTPIATLFLDQDLRIKKFTPTATELFSLIPTDLGRPLLDIAARFEIDPLVERLNLVRAGQPGAELEIKGGAERWFSVRINRYRTSEGDYDGVIVNFIDITALKHAEAAAREALAENQRFHEIGMAFAHELDIEKLVQKITDAATSVSRAQFGAFFYNALNEQGESYMLYTISGVPRSAFENFPMPRNTAIFEPTFRGTSVMRSDDITKDPRYGKNAPHYGMPKGHLPVVSYLAAPVISRTGEVIGGLFFGHKDAGVFDERAEKLVLGIAAQAAVALDNAHMVQNLRRSARSIEESDRRFRQLADSMPQIIWAARPDGHADYYNRRWYEFTGFPEGGEGDESWQPVLHPADRDICMEAWYAAVRSGAPYEVRYRFYDRKTDAYRWHLGRALPVRDENGAIVRWFGTCTDIDDLVRAERALKDAAERKDEFLAMLGHELRNPLAPIQSAVALLDLQDSSEEERFELRSILDRQVKHLARIVDDLLDVARISRGKILLRKEPVDLVALAHTVIVDYRHSIQSNGLTLHVETPSEPLWVEGDPTRISQIISNLLQNASKFTESGGEIRVELRQQDDRAVIQIRDTGAGMTPETIRRLFEPFNQADTTIDRSRGGLGLGLALVKGLVGLHEGSVRAESAGLKQGSAIVVELPVTDKRPKAAQDAVRPSSSSLHIVIIEDNADAASTLARLLRRRGHHVSTASDGRTGLEVAQAEKADVVLCDIGLPGDLDGYAIARKLRSLAASKPLLLVALTGYGQEQDQHRALTAGFDHHLTKPVDFAHLEKLIVDWRGN